MKEDATAKLVPCDYNKEGKQCNYVNSDNSTYGFNCECTLNENGDAYCPAAQKPSIIFFNYFNKTLRNLVLTTTQLEIPILIHVTLYQEDFVTTLQQNN